MLGFVSGARSHVGLVREHNEDSGYSGPYLQLVADGVGGAAAGEVASATTAYVLSARAAIESDDAVVVLTQAVQEAHRQLRDGVRADPARSGMATTLTAVLAHGDGFAMAHIGDSRAYVRRDGGLRQLTTDHTFVQALVDEGRMTADEIAAHPYRSVVLKSIQSEDPPQPDVVRLELEPGDRLLLCSDGLSDLVASGHIDACLQEADPDAAAAALVDAALQAGGRDNITCLVADVTEVPQTKPYGVLLGAMRDPRLIVDPTAVRSPALPEPEEHAL